MWLNSKVTEKNRTLVERGATEKRNQGDAIEESEE
jgi:hypothetical protein